MRYISFLLCCWSLLWAAAATAQKTVHIIGTTDKNKSVSSTQPSTANKAKPTTPTTAPKTGTTPVAPPKTGTASTPSTTVAVSTVVQPSLYLTGADSVFVRVENGQRILLHTVRTGEYPLIICRFYGIQPLDFYYNNPESANTGLRVGQQARIPIALRAIRRHTGSDFRIDDYVPVFYRVETGETLYRVAKTHFGLPMEVVKHRNRMETDVVYKNQVLHIGWIQRTGIPDSLHRYMGTGGALGEENNRLRTQYEQTNMLWQTEQKVKKPEKVAEGIAYWLKGERFASSNQLIVLYSGAPIGSIVKLENPMVAHSCVYAQVVGKLPDTPESQGTIILLSANVALALGGGDARLPVRVSHLPKLPK